MGCGATKEVIKRSQDDLAVSSRIALQSTGGLQLVLQQSVLRDAFRTFIHQQWNPANRDNTSYFVSQARTIAANCLDFWTDARDFCRIKKSAFRTYRAVFIFEKYLMHGAAKQVPVSINVLDEIVAALFNGSTDAEVEVDVFAAAEIEVLDFLVSEVFPAFELTSYSMLAKNQALQVIRALGSSLSTIPADAADTRSPNQEPTDQDWVRDRDHDQGRRSSQQGHRHRTKIRSPADKAILTDIMYKLLSDREYLPAFKAYLHTEHEEHILYAYNEALEISEKFAELSLIPDAEVRLSIFLHAVNGFYDKYVALGAGSRISIPEATHGDLMRRFASSGNIEQEALLPIEHECFDYLMRVHLEGFLATPVYRQLVRSGRRSVLMLFYQLKTSHEHPAKTETPSVPAEDTAGEAARTEPTQSEPAVARPLGLQLPRLSFGKRRRISDPRRQDTPLNTLTGPMVHLAPAQEEDELSDEDEVLLEDDQVIGPASPQSSLDISSVGSPGLSPIGSPLSPGNPLSPTALSPPASSSTPPGLQRGVSSLDSEELTAWLARGGRRSSTVSSSTGSSAVPVTSLAMQDLIPSVNHADMRELKNFIRSGYDELLGRYLESKGALAVMYFYQSATRFQEAHFNHDVERLSECTMLFDRYISRNAEDKIPLPELIRKDIVKQLLRGKQTLYAIAAKWAVHSLCADHWGEFKREVNAGAAEDATEAGGASATERAAAQGQMVTTMGSVQFTVADDGSVALPVNSEGSAVTSENSLNTIPAKNPEDGPKTPAASTGRDRSRSSTLVGSPKPAMGFEDANHLDAAAALASRAAKAFPVATQSPPGPLRDLTVIALSPLSFSKRDARLSGCYSSPPTPALSPVRLPPGCDIRPDTSHEAPDDLTPSNVLMDDDSVQDVVGPLPNAAAIALAGKLTINLSRALSTGSGSMTASDTQGTPNASARDAFHPRTPMPKMTPKSPQLPLLTLTIPERSVSQRPDTSRSNAGGTPHHSVHTTHSAVALQGKASSTPHSASMRDSLRLSLARMAGLSAHSGVSSNSSAYDLVASTSGKLRRYAKPAAVTQPDARAVLEHPQCCSAFKAFLDHEGLAQTVLFCIEVEEFRRIPSFDFQLVRARKIYTKYMHEMSVMPVPVTTFTRNEIFKCITGAVVLPTLFKCAAEEVVRYIELFQFPRFVQSTEMHRVNAILSAEALQPTRLPRRSSLTVHAMHVPDSLNLKSILKNQTCTRYFKDYCAKMYCTENLLFYLDVENYKNLPGSDYMRRVACKVYKKYIADGAKMQVNVSFAAKQDIFGHLLDGDRQLFRKAQLEVFNLMKADTMPKFANSAEYAVMVKSLKTDEQIVQQSSQQSLHPAPANAIAKFALHPVSQPRRDLTGSGAGNPGAGDAAAAVVTDPDLRGRPPPLQLVPLVVDVGITAAHSTGMHAGAGAGAGALRSSFGLGSAAVGVGSSPVGAAVYVPSPTAALRSTVKPTVRTHAL